MPAPVLVNVTNATSSSVTIPATTQGNCLIVCISSTGASASSVSGITLGGSADNFASLAGVLGTDTLNRHADSYIWADPNCAGGQTALSISGSNLGLASITGGVVVYEFSGLAPTILTLLDRFSIGASSLSNSTTWTSNTTGVTVNPVEVWVGVGTGRSTVNAPSSPWITEDLNSHIASGYQVTSSVGNATYSGTQSSNAGWSACVVTLIPSQGSVFPVPASPGPAWKSMFRKHAVPVYNVVTQVNVPASQPKPSLSAVPGSTWKRNFLRHSVPVVNTTTLVSVPPSVSQPQAPDQPGLTWKRMFQKGSVHVYPPQPAIGQVLPPVPQPVLPVNPGRTWRKVFNFPRHMLPVVTTIPGFYGSSILVNVSARYGTVKTNYAGSVSSVTGTANPGSIRELISKSVNVAVSSPYGILKSAEAGTQAGITVSASSVSVSESVHISRVNIVASSATGSLKENISVSSAQVTASAQLGTVKIVKSVSSGVAVQSVYGSVNTRISMPGAGISASASTVRLSRTIPGLSVNVTARIPAFSVLVSKILNINGSVNAVYGSVLNAIQVSGSHNSVAASSDKIKISQSPGVIPVLSGSSPGLSAKVSPMTSGMTVLSSYGGNKISPKVNPSSVIAVAQREGVKTSLNVINISASANMGKINIYSSPPPAQVSCKINQGLAGRTILTASLSAQNWSAVVIPPQVEE